MVALDELDVLQGVAGGKAAAAGVIGVQLWKPGCLFARWGSGGQICGGFGWAYSGLRNIRTGDGRAVQLCRGSRGDSGDGLMDRFWR